MAEMDRAEKAASETARPIAAFYLALKGAGMPEAQACRLTEMYARKVLGV